MDDKTNLTPEQDEVQTGEEVSFTISGEDAAAQEALNAKKTAKKKSDNQKARARYQTKGFPASWHCTFSPLKANTNITPQPMANRMYQSQRSAGNCLRNATNSHV